MNKRYRSFVFKTLIKQLSVRNRVLDREDFIVELLALVALAHQLVLTFALVKAFHTVRHNVLLIPTLSKLERALRLVVKAIQLSTKAFALLAPLSCRVTHLRRVERGRVVCAVRSAHKGRALRRRRIPAVQRTRRRRALQAVPRVAAVVHRLWHELRRVSSAALVRENRAAVLQQRWLARPRPQARDPLASACVSSRHSRLRGIVLVVRARVIRRRAHRAAPCRTCSCRRGAAKGRKPRAVPYLGGAGRWRYQKTNISRCVTKILIVWVAFTTGDMSMSAWISESTYGSLLPHVQLNELIEAVFGS